MIRSSVVERLRMFATLAPVVLFVIFFDFKNYPLLNLSFLWLSAVGGVEMNRLLQASFGIFVSTSFAFFLGAYPVLLSYILTVFGCGQYAAETFIASFIAIVFIVSLSLLSNKDSSVEKLLARFLMTGIIFFYPGLIFFFASRISLIADSSAYILLLAFAVFSNDSLAYVFGRLLGRWIPGSLKVSPKKTVIGFAGGTLGTVLSLMASSYAGILPFNLLTSVFVGILLGFASIWGDLLESSFKRRAGIKDSGTLVKGRGGVLDCCDSFFFATPLLYYALTWFN